LACRVCASGQDGHKLIGLVDEPCEVAVQAEQLGSGSQLEPVARFSNLFERNPGLMDEVSWAFRTSRFLVVGPARRAASLQLFDDGFAPRLLSELRKQLDDSSS